MTTAGSSGMPPILARLAPLLFAPPDKQARKVVASAHPGAHQGQSGIFVSGGRIKKMPGAAVDLGVQTSLVALLDGLVHKSPR